MSEDFTVLMKDIGPQIHETQQIPNKMKLSLGS